MEYLRLAEIAARPDSDERELLAALTALAGARRELDDLERDLIHDARAAGASWSRIAAALNLTSRQAAEQRWLRLQGMGKRDPGGVRARRAQPSDDVTPDLGDLAAAADAVHRDLRARVGGGPRQRLAKETLRQAREAPAGSLFDLVRQALADLGDDPAPAVENLRRALDTAYPGTKD